MRLDLRAQRRIESLRAALPKAYLLARAHGRERAAVGVLVGLAISSLVAGSSAAASPEVVAVSRDGSVRDLGAAAALDRLDSPWVKLPEDRGDKARRSARPTATTVPDSEVTDLGIPEVALQAYRSAMASMDVADPGCRLDWSLIAGIGRVESDHGQYGGRRPATDGTVAPPILGIPLDGRPGVALIRDTDGGRLDFDTTYDRAVGPMQFIPGTWSAFPDADGDGNGVADPHNLYDAALATANYLCSGPGDLSADAGQRAAVFRYNHSDSYVELVLAYARAYAAGVTLSGPPPPPAGQVPTVPDDPITIPAHPGEPLPGDSSGQPTEPAVPTPTEPTQPIPTEPAVPPPTEPAVPTPTEPAVPTPTEPAVPTPTEPPEPTEPTVPIQTTELPGASTAPSSGDPTGPASP